MTDSTSIEYNMRNIKMLPPSKNGIDTFKHIKSHTKVNE